MIIERITAIRAIPPEIVRTKVPVGRISHMVETVRYVGTHERTTSTGASGTDYDITYSDTEIGFYSRKDVTVYAERTQIRPR